MADASLARPPGGAGPALVIFDCDGVLIDSEIVAARVDAACLGELGIAIAPEDILDRYVGLSVSSMLEDLAARHGRAMPTGLAEELLARTAAAFDTDLAAIPGVAAAVDRLARPVCVASSSRPERLAHSLGLVGLWDRFHPHVFSASMVARGKPAPDLFLFAADRMGARPADCLVIEDSLAGVQAAVAAGMRVLGFHGGSHCRPGHADRLAAAGAAATFGRMEELAALL